MVDDADYRTYNAITRGLDHEAKVMADRIQWAITFTGGLFAASALLITIIVFGKPQALVVSFLLILMSSIAAIGVIFSWTTRSGGKAAQAQFEDLRSHYNDRVAKFNALDLPRPFGDRDAHYSGNFSARVFPVILLVCWIAAFALTLGAALVVAGAVEAELLYRIWPALAPTQ